MIFWRAGQFAFPYEVGEMDEMPIVWVGDEGNRYAVDRTGVGGEAQKTMLEVSASLYNI